MSRDDVPYAPGEIRGYLWSVRYRVGRHGFATRWNYRVEVGFLLLAADNGGTYDAMQEACRRDVAAFRRVLGLGYKLSPKTWDRLVDQAPPL